MSKLLEQALEKVAALPPDQQDAIAAQILDELADEERWDKRFAEKADVLRRLAEDAIEAHEHGETRPLSDLL
jgi:hypothetical protein